MTTPSAMMRRYCAASFAKRPPRVSSLALAACALLLYGHSAAAAATHWVNDDAANYTPPGTSCTNAGYLTIQAAVDAASPGDVILVCPGAYGEHVVIGTSDLTVRSTNGAAATMVKPAASTFVFLIDAPRVTVNGFTMIPFGFGDLDIGVHVQNETAWRVRILQNAIFGGRIGINLGCVTFRNVVASNTVNGQTEAGINIDTCEAPPFPGSRFNAIYRNVACSATSVGSIALGGSSNNNRITHNIATKISVAGMGNAVTFNTTQLAIVDGGSDTVLNNNLADLRVCPESSGGA